MSSPAHGTTFRRALGRRNVVQICLFDGDRAPVALSGLRLCQTTSGSSRLTALAPAPRAAVVAYGYLNGLGNHFADPHFDFLFAMDGNANRVCLGACLRDAPVGRDGDLDLSGLGNAYRVAYLAGLFLQFDMATPRGAGTEFRFVTADLDHLGPRLGLIDRDGVFTRDLLFYYFATRALNFFFHDIGDPNAAADGSCGYFTGFAA